ncbi:hypothetical protein EDC01DRAFT_674275 [Geopyxis carbonaria]|nr:hypothetical protein EDC01DRAFT_674275 [Geopyxis carbonaria]
MMDAESFYDKLLASLGQTSPTCDPVNASKSATAEPEATSTAPPPQPEPSVPSPSLEKEPSPPNQAKFAKVLTETPTVLSPEAAVFIPAADAQPKPVTSVPVEVETLPSTAKETASQQPEQSTTDSKSISSKKEAAPASKSSATLEAELRAKLLASSKKRKFTTQDSRTPTSQPKPRPLRGSPVFTAVQLSTSISPVSPNPTRADNVFNSPPPTKHEQQALPNGKLSLPPKPQLSLPPKPPRREGFRLRLRMPFSTSSSRYITLETERLPLSTPISAILDLFGRRAPPDHLYFPSSHSSQSAADDSPGTEAEFQGPTGQRFYRDPPRGAEQLAGWRQLAAARSAASCDANTVGNLRATLEDVSTVAHADIVECEIRCGMPTRHPSDSDNVYAHDSEMAEAWDEDQDGGDGEEEGDWGHSPELEQGEWTGDMYGQNPQQQQWQFPFNPQATPHQIAFPPMPTPWMQPEFPMPTAGPLPDGEGDVQRWIPGHRDYDNAGWMFGMHNVESPHQHMEQQQPLPPPPQPLPLPPPPHAELSQPLSAPSQLPVSASQGPSMASRVGPVPNRIGPVPSDRERLDRKKHRRRGSGAMRRRRDRERGTRGGYGK